jgi:hypothetical protein
MADVMDDIFSGLNALCMRELSNITLLSIEKKVFGKT